MPKSKKPRKAHKRKGCGVINIPKADIDTVKEFVTDVQLIVEIKLPRGTCNESDIQMIRQFLNWATVLIYVDGYVDTDYFLEQYDKEYAKLQEAFRSWYGRHLKTGGVTATGDELNALRNGFDLVGVVIKESMNHMPYKSLRAWMCASRLADGKPHDISMTLEKLKKEFANEVKL